MIWIFILFVGLSLLISLKQGRPDGRVLEPHPYRRMMPLLMPTRQGSVAMAESFIPVDNLEAYLASIPEERRPTLTHLVVAALAETLHLHPNLNRFEAGGRLYQRYGVQISMSLKRDMGDRGSKVAVVKRGIRQGTTPAELAKILREEIAEARSTRPSYVDREMDLLLRLPHALLWLGVRLMGALHHLHLLPGGFIEKDPLFASAFVANLGSLKMRDAYHHLYEWGTISVFLVLGKTEERILSVDGEPRSVRGLPIRWTLDERVDDGMTADYALREFEEILNDPQRIWGNKNSDDLNE